MTRGGGPADLEKAGSLGSAKRQICPFLYQMFTKAKLTLLNLTKAYQIYQSLQNFHQSVLNFTKIQPNVGLLQFCCNFKLL